MSIECSIAIPAEGYLRTFESEIDVLAENELLVRGVMSDHRFAFEHRWNVRGPDYEVIEASAWQIAGVKSELDPDLCHRYAWIVGVRIGMCFSNLVSMALDNWLVS